MANKMLIDASHPEETRVVVLRGNRVEEFDFESASRKPLRGNIYLAKVTRVEPSLQAAFVEYGGNRHGFLAFSEIHPDYYQIPVADRQALLAEEAEEDDEDEEERRPPRGRRRRREAPAGRRQHSDDATVSEAAPDQANGETDRPEEHAFAAHPADDMRPLGDLAETGSRESEGHESAKGEAAHQEAAHPGDADQQPGPEASIEESFSDEPQDAAAAAAIGGPAAAELEGASTGLDHHESESSEVAAPVSSELSETPRDHESREPDENAVARHDSDESAEEDDEDEDEEEEHVEQVGGDALEEAPRRKPRLRRHYKIQEVIKRRQILLVQVVKEERGNKGAALTTYLSLAGRYSVLMPNTARGGGISRKITDAGDRKRLKSIVQELDVPEGMGIILRTAGASRTRSEVKRDFEYLLRMWENVRELTLRSSAPKLVYEEGSLIKRAIRDLYNKDVDEVLVAGEAAWREAKDFMRLIMPSHVRQVVPWRDPQPVFAKHGVEAQLDAMFSNHVTLRSGGYLVINQTEALVAIDVNSGRSTREHNIEDTALRTNLEAADEVARQLRLRDLAGLIVVDFIDMEEHRNNRSVERRLKEALKNDRARIQVGRISHFGLLEMSRQRIRAGVLEGSTAPCPHCAGSGTVRSVHSVALHVLRVLEDALMRSATHDLIVRTRTDVALYILNEKRSHLREIERRFGVHVRVEADERMTGTTYHAIERGDPATGTPEPFVAPPWEPEIEEEPVEASEAEAEDEFEPAEADESRVDADEANGGAEAGEGDAEEAGRRRRRRRRRRGRGDRDANGAPPASPDAPQPSDEGLAIMAGADPSGYVHVDSANGGREGYWAREASGTPVPFRPARDAEPEAAIAAERIEASVAVLGAEPAESASPMHDPQAASSLEAPTSEAAPRDMQPAPQDLTPTVQGSADPATAAAQQPASAPETFPPAPEPAPVAPPREPTEVVITRADPDRPKRGGWWQRAKATLGGG